MSSSSRESRRSPFASNGDEFRRDGSAGRRIDGPPAMGAGGVLLIIERHVSRVALRRRYIDTLALWQQLRHKLSGYAAPDNAADIDAIINNFARGPARSRPPPVRAAFRVLRPSVRVRFRSGIDDRRDQRSSDRLFGSFFSFQRTLLRFRRSVTARGAVSRSLSLSLFLFPFFFFFTKISLLSRRGMRGRRTPEVNRIDTLPPFVNSLTATMNAARDARHLTGRKIIRVITLQSVETCSPQFAKSSHTCTHIIIREHTRFRARAREMRARS